MVKNKKQEKQPEVNKKDSNSPPLKSQVKEKKVHMLMKLKNFSFKQFSQNIKENFVNAIDTSKYLVSFAYLLTVYLLYRFVSAIGNARFFPGILREKCSPALTTLYKKLITPASLSEKTINRLNLIELAIRNMGYKKTRSIITIGGMAVGIGAIVFLVSIGFGLQELVVGRVARLEELKQAEVTSQTGSKVDIDDKTINDIKNIPEVNDVQPLIAVVGRVSFNESVSDVAAFGVTTRYLESSAIRPVRGRIFESNDLTVSLPVDEDENVLGIDNQREIARYGEKIQEVDFVIEQEAWLPVREGPSAKSTLLGYTRRVPGTQYGEEYWGSSYISDDGVGSAGTDIDGNSLGKWIKSTFRLWDKEICLLSENPDCEENQYVVQRDGDTHFEEIGYIIERDMSVREMYAIDRVTGDVLGEATDEASVELSQIDPKSIQEVSNALKASSTDDLYDGFDLDASSEALLQAEGIIASDSAAGSFKEVEVDKRAVKEAVVNRAMLSLLGIDEGQAIGQNFEVSFVVVGNLTEGEEKIQSVPTQYEIVGIDPETDTPFFYVPFIDLRSLGVTKYSQLKVISIDEGALAKIRQQIEVFGYATSSVTDTVERITSFFSSLRIVLALLGGVALAVASLGMFNTLTVSLLERTREVGLMKAMGMRSYEVRELFLTESMIMGFFGGLLGIGLGIGGGYIISLILTIFSLSKGSGVIIISHTPFVFIAMTMLFAMFVGLATGIYPARRATKISALNALRYE